MKIVFLIPIKLYQWCISPLFPPSCRYVPSCSEYTLQAVQERGVLRGITLGIKRILRCHPWGGQGYDPVPPCEHHCHEQGRI